MGAIGGGTLALCAVVFDYGEVLSGHPDPGAKAELLRITGLPLDRFEELYWADRPAYDGGKLNGIDFWQKLLRDANLNLGPGTAAELNQWDARMWTTSNPAMLAWQLELKRRGILTAILSNMGHDVLENMKREFDWLSRFDVLAWSFQLHMVMPNPAIYRHVLGELGTRPEETLFLDDRLINIQAAQALGFQAIQFSSAAKLRDDLIAKGLDRTLPLP